jgi:hypothetical protein
MRICLSLVALLALTASADAGPVRNAIRDHRVSVGKPILFPHLMPKHTGRGTAPPAQMAAPCQSASTAPKAAAGCPCGAACVCTQIGRAHV